MNFSWRNLIIFITDRCRTGCPSCNAGSTPSGQQQISVRRMKQLMDIAAGLPFNGHVIFTGGEPFLNFSALAEGIANAFSRGFHCEILTSGHEDAVTGDRLRTLAGLGRPGIRFSLDADHQSTVPLDMVSRIIDAADALELPVRFTLRNIPGAHPSVADIRAHLQRRHPGLWAAHHGDSRWIHVIPHVPGHGSASTGSEGGTVPIRPCGWAFRDMVIGADAHVYPCCGLFGVPHREILRLGHAGDGLNTAAAVPDAPPVLTTLRSEGPAGLLNRLGLDQAACVPGGTANACRLCQAFFHDFLALGLPDTPPGSISVILPCAGEGSRLGIDGPKELLELLPGHRLIDFSLDHIRAFMHSRMVLAHRPRVGVITVIRPGKESVFEYVRAALPGITVTPVMFNPAYSEWPGSVHSAAPEYGDLNLVLLPDSELQFSRGSRLADQRLTPLLEAMVQALSASAVVFGVIPCTDPRRLERLGAVHADDRGTITGFQDKPVDQQEKFNGFWGCYGFHRTAGTGLYDFLIRSVNHQPVCIQDQDFAPVRAVMVHGYRDLGTWDAILEYRRQNAISDSIRWR